jgi:hypothetical protein
VGFEESSVAPSRTFSRLASSTSEGKSPMRLLAGRMALRCVRS